MLPYSTSKACARTKRLISKVSEIIPLFNADISEAGLRAFKTEVYMKRDELFELEKEEVIKESDLLSLSSRALHHLYEHSCKILTAKYKQQLSRTNSENYIARKIKNETKLKCIPGAWIGKFNVDFFLPGLRGGNSNCGVAIEVDGGIHNHEIKMKKDNYKYNLLRDLGIALMTISNDDRTEQTSINFINNLKNLPRADSRLKRRMWVKIYRKTIMAAFSNMSDLESVMSQLSDKKKETNLNIFTNIKTKDTPKEDQKLFDNQLLTYKRAALYLGVSISYLRQLKSTRKVPYVLVGSRAIRFRVTALDSFIKKREVSYE